MKVRVIKEVGYDEAALGFSLSYNTKIERAMEIMPKYAFGVPGEGKFLESMLIYIDVTAPRFWWQEADTYRVGTTKQSESTMHTIMKRDLTQNDFEREVDTKYLHWLNTLIYNYRIQSGLVLNNKKEFFLDIKSALPEGFLQRRIWMINYKTLQNMWVQRKSHKLPQWIYFLDTVVRSIEHPEFIIKDYSREG